MSLPNVVLVHGAWADGSCWAGVIQLPRPLGRSSAGSPAAR